MLTKMLRRVVAKKKRPFFFQRYNSNVDFAAAPDDVGLYIHIPFCTALCPYCPYNKMEYDARLARGYRTALLRELGLLKELLPRKKFRSIYVGGGTPTLMLDEVAELLGWVRQQFGPVDNIGIEVHPQQAGPHVLEKIKAAGINMVSLGIQSFDDRKLKELGRNYSGSEALGALEAAVGASFDCVDADIMYNLPNQTVASVERDVSLCLQAGVDQLSVYPLIVFPLTALHRRLQRRKVRRFSPLQEYRVLKNIDAVAKSHGYARASVWTYCRPNAPKYTSVTRESFVGVGAGAASQFGNYFYLNTFDVRAYIERASQGRLPINLVNVMGRRELMAYWLFWRCYESAIDLDRFYQLFGVRLQDQFPLLHRLARLARLARKEGNCLQLTPAGLYFYHLLEKHYSLTYLNDMWAASMGQPWLDKVSL